MTAPAWMCLGHRTRGELAPICRDCERQCDEARIAVASPAATLVVDNRPTVICQHWHSRPIPEGEAQDSDFSEWIKYGGTD